jgi:hypothetical protein
MEIQMMRRGPLRKLLPAAVKKVLEQSLTWGRSPENFGSVIPALTTGKALSKRSALSPQGALIRSVGIV